MATKGDQYTIVHSFSKFENSAGQVYFRTVLHRLSEKSASLSVRLTGGEKEVSMRHSSHKGGL